MPQARHDLNAYRESAQKLLERVALPHPNLDLRINPVGSVHVVDTGAYVECVVFVPRDSDA